MISGKEYLKILLRFWEYRSGKYISLLEERLKKLYGDKHIYLFGNGRSAQYIFLKSLNLPKNSNVIIQSFTCNAVVNPILWLDLEPRYVDIDPENFSASIEDLKKKIDENTKVIVLQHTFGITGPIDEVIEIAKTKGIYVLEDCAHSLGNMETGMTGDAAMLSFGIEKVLATRAGGALVVNNEKLVAGIDNEYKKLRTMGLIETKIWLLNPIFWRILRMLGPVKYTFAKLLRKVRLLNMGFEDPELLGRKPKNYPKRLSNALSRFILEELNDLSTNLEKRRSVSAMYDKLLGRSYSKYALVRYPYLLDNFWQVKEVSDILKKRGVAVGDWYNPVVYPASTNLASMKYVVGSCPVAEKVAKRIVNLPTGGAMSREDAEKAANAINSVVRKK